MDKGKQKMGVDSRALSLEDLQNLLTSDIRRVASITGLEVQTLCISHVPAGLTGVIFILLQRILAPDCFHSTATFSMERRPLA